MREKRMAHSGPEARRRLCGKVLRRDGTYEPDEPQRDEHETHPYDIRPVFPCDPHVDDRRHDQRHEQLKRRLEHFKKRRQYGFLFIIF